METQNIGISMLFNDVDLAQWLIVSDVQRNVGTSHTNTTVKIGNSDGSLWQNMSRNSSTIVVTGILHGDLAALRRTFAGAIDYDEPKVLVFGDEPDVYYNAIYDGQPTMTELSHTGTVSLSFLVPDGVAHSVVSSTATLDDSGQIMIDNKGTYPTWPIITAKMKSENGLVGLVNDKGGALQFGDPEEVDTVTKQRSEHALRVGYDSEPKGIVYNKIASTYPNYLYDASKPNSQKGTIAYGIDPSKGSGAIPTFTNTSSDYWAGPSGYLPIKANSAGKSTGNFILKNRFYFATSKGQLGRLEFVLQNGSKVAYSAVLRDSQSSTNELIVEFYVGQTMIFTKRLDRKKYSNGMFREFKITKQGANIQFQLAAVTDIKAGNTSVIRDAVIKNWTLSDANIPVDGFGFWFQRFKNTSPVVMDVTDTQFDWVNVPYIVDIPNYYQDGDEVTIDTARRKVYVNGVLDNNLQRVGNDWDTFALQPGLNTIQPVASSWATMYDCTVTYEEAWK